MKQLSDGGARVGPFTFFGPDKGWMAVGATILTSDDGGRRWSKLSEVPGPVSYLDFISLRQGWAASATGLLVTNDGGTTWRTIYVGSTSRVHFVDPDRGWIDASEAFLRTVDGGSSWTPVADPCPKNIGLGPFSFISASVGWILCGGVPATQMQDKRLYRTVDGGLSWTLIASTRAGDRQPGVVGALPSGGHVLPGRTDLSFLDDTHGWFGTSRGQLQATDDGGMSWRAISIAPHDAEEFFETVRLTSPRSGYVAVLKQGAMILLATRDGGATWSQVYPSVFPVGPAYFVDWKNGIGTGTSLDPGAVLRTADGGRTWSQIASLKDESIADSSFPDSQHGWILSESWDAATSTSTRTLYRTKDGGITWAKVSSGAMGEKERYAGLSFVDANTGYVWSGWGHLSVTHDGGDTFQSVISTDSTSSPFQFVSSDVGWKIDDYQIYATENGGRSWTIVPLGYRAWGFQLLRGGHAWVQASDCAVGNVTDPCVSLLLSTSDGGRTWIRHDLGPIARDGVSPIFVDADHGWLKGGTHLYATVDGGRSWTQVR